MRIPIIIQITDKHQQGHNKNGPVTVLVMSADTKLPFIQFECNRQDLCSAAGQKATGHLNSEKIDGFLTTKDR